MQRISKSKLKPHMLHIFREIEESGEEYIVTDHGKAVLKIIPYSENSDDMLKDLHGTVKKYDNPLDPVGLDDWDMLK